MPEPDIVIAWDPRAISPEEYAKLVVLLGDVVREEGGKGLERIRPMIQNEAEYLRAKKDLQDGFEDLQAHVQKLRDEGLNEGQIAVAMAPSLSTWNQLQREVLVYENNVYTLPTPNTDLSGPDLA